MQLTPLRTADGGMPGGVEDEAFQLADVKPDRYAISVSGMPDNVYVKSMSLGTREAMGFSTCAVALEKGRWRHGPLTGAAVGLVEDREGRL